MPVRYDQDTKAKASGLVGEHAGDYPSEYAAITAVAGRLEMTPETLRKWIRQAAVDEGQAPEVTTAASQEICELSPRCRWESTAKASSRGSGRPSWACSAAIQSGTGSGLHQADGRTCGLHPRIDELGDDI